MMIGGEKANESEKLLLLHDDVAMLSRAHYVQQFNLMQFTGIHFLFFSLRR